MATTRLKAKDKEAALLASGKTKEYRRHIVCVLDDSPSMKRQAEAWVDLKNEHYKIIKKYADPTEEKPFYEYMEAKKDSKNKFLTNVDPDSILYLYCHGSTENSNNNILAENTKLWVKNFDDSDSRKIKEYKPTDLLNFLKDQGLNPNHKILKIAACYSDKFAEGFSIASKNDFPQLCVYGYSGQLIVAQGLWGGKLAGFTIGGADSLLIKDGDHYSLDTTKFNLDPNNKNLYRAKNFRSGYMAGIKLEEKATQQDSSTNINSSQINQQVLQVTQLDAANTDQKNNNTATLGTSSPQRVSRAKIWPAPSGYLSETSAQKHDSTLTQLGSGANTDPINDQSANENLRENQDKTATDSDIIDSTSSASRPSGP